MEAKDIFEANSRSIRELLCERGLGLYIPPYQRNYSWKKDDVMKLMNDILHGLNKLLTSKDSFTFLGTIITIHDTNNVTVHPYVKQHLPGKILAIIDGQQRLTTLLMLCIALHNRITILHHVFKKNERNFVNSPGLFTWLNDLSLDALRDLKEAFIEEKSSGQKIYYPRMIRAFKDQWSIDQDKAQYNSPFAHLTNMYSEQFNSEKEFKISLRSSPEEGEKELLDRYNQIVKHLKEINNLNQDLDDEYECIPNLDKVIARPEYQEALLNYEFPDYVLQGLRNDSIAEKARHNYINLLNVVLLCKYIFNRVALTVVRGRDEDYAFTIFESLNTTGSPLTAFETFKPRVVSAEKLEKYGQSDAKKLVDDISEYFSQGNNDHQQKTTRDTIVSFALAETGKKLTTRLPDQRAYLRLEYDQYKEKTDRNLFLTHLKDTAKFLQYCWNDDDPKLPPETAKILSDEARLCLSFLCTLNHTVTIAPLVRYYSTANSNCNDEQGWKNFEIALKAITAFSVLWRASHSSTGNIDQEYRLLMQGDGDFLGVARSQQQEAPSPDTLKSYLHARLLNKFSDQTDLKEKWADRAKQYVLYTTQKHLAKFLLLAGHHDTDADSSAPGLVKKARRGSSPQLTYERWEDDISATIEHIAPQEQNPEWPQVFYSDDMLLNCLGNLVLLPQNVNSATGKKNWETKKAIYAAFAAKDIDEAKRILNNAGINVSVTLEALNAAANHIPQLESLVLVPDWTQDIVNIRAKRLLENSWDVIYPWLNS